MHSGSYIELAAHLVIVADHDGRPDIDGPGGWALAPGKDIEHRRLTGATRPDDPETLAWPEDEVDASEHRILIGSIKERDVFALDDFVPEAGGADLERELA